MSNSNTVGYKQFPSSNKIWKYFHKSEDNLTAKCLLCKAILKTTARSTKGLHVHLKSRHGIQDLCVSEQSDTNTGASTTPSTSTEKTADLPSGSKKSKITDHFSVKDNKGCSMEERVSRMAAKDGLPLSVFVTSEDLRELFKTKGHVLPNSSTTIRMMIMNYGMTIKMKIIRDLAELKENDYRFSLTFDEWTSTGNRRYMNINIHTFANDRNMFWNLGLVRVHGSMPAVICIEILKKKLNEYDLDLDKDIVAITTDGAAVMVKVGKLITPFHQLCYAHCLQLGILDVIYNKPKNSNEICDDEETVEEELISENEQNEGFIVSLSSPNEEVELSSNFKELINKVRKVVVLFKGSPTKNDSLQDYVQKEFGRKIELIRDCKTRWSSLCNMIESFNRLKLCVAKTLIDIGLGTNNDYCFSEHELESLSDLERILKPVKLTVEVLCRQDANLLTAETSLKFMITKLEENSNSMLARELADSLRRRIEERRTNMTAVLIYLQNPIAYQSYHASEANATFGLPAKSVIRREIKGLIQNLKFNALSPVEDDDADAPLSVLSEKNVQYQAADASNTQNNTATQALTLQDELEQTLNSAMTSFCPSPAQIPLIENIIKKEMTLYESGGSMGKYLTLAHNALKSIVPTSVEAERAFSAAGYLANKIRSSLGDETLGMLCFLRKHFQNAK